MSSRTRRTIGREVERRSRERAVLDAANVPTSMRGQIFADQAIYEQYREPWWPSWDELVRSEL